jgi:outer membrane protein assembly factor BamE (lipoprotein component of BamABCDE complex)
MFKIFYDFFLIILLITSISICNAKIIEQGDIIDITKVKLLHIGMHKNKVLYVLGKSKLEVPFTGYMCFYQYKKSEKSKTENIFIILVFYKNLLSEIKIEY